jgi:hypothetical protein
LLLTIIEAYGALFSRTFSIPGIGHWAATGFIEDLFAVGVLCGIITFTVIRIRNNPYKEGRRSRFFGSHTRAAWVVLAMIAAVIITLLIYRGAQENTGVFPYENDGAWPFASWLVGKALHPLGYGVNSVLEVVFILLQLGVIMAFLVVVTYSKHLHIGLAGFNVLFSRRPDALGPLEPMRSGGKVLDFEEADPDTDVFGIGKVEDLTWKGMLDLGTCTECGRCQSQCPAWATGKPLSPKQLILDLRDHAFAKAPYLLADEDGRVGLSAEALAEAERPLVGDLDANGVINPDVIWACTNCSPSRTSRRSTRQGSAPTAGRRSSPPALTASTPSAASTPSSAVTTRLYTTPSCSPNWSKTASSLRSTRLTRRSPTTTPASSAATTRSSPRPASSSAPCPAPKPRK